MITDYKKLNESEKIISDEASTTVTYIGYGEAATATSDAKWIIQKIESASGSNPTGVTTTKWATAFMDKSNVWDNRAALTYV